MATQLLCPQCRAPLPGAPVRNEPGECPHCKSAYTAPKVKSPKSAVKILQSKPFTPPATTPREPEPARARGPILVTLVTAVVVAAAIVWVIRRPAPEPSTPDKARADQTAAIAKVEPPKTERPPLLRDPIPVKPNNGPRVRPIQSTGPTRASLLDPIARKPHSAVVPQEAIDKAIAAGIEFLKKNPHRWFLESEHEIGHVSLPGLSLLEVGVAENDPVILKAAAVVRRLAPKERNTYDLSLAILFLDKLGDPADEPLIRTLGLRLVAGQTTLFGWDYRCPMLTTEMEPPLLAALEALQPKTKLGVPLPREAGKGLIDLQIPLAGGAPAAPKESRLVMPLDLKSADHLVKALPEGLRDLPILRPLDAPSPSRFKGRGGRDDNSNTQFSLLALWAARRHGVPVDRSLLLADRRFALSQLENGAWAYRVNDGDARPSMTCVGLLSLALGHGALLPESPEPNRPLRQPGDPAIDRGLSALATSIGQPGERMSGPNLYFLWSVERVGVLYNLPTIGGKDWYGWGATHLLRAQRPDGSWPSSQYHGSDAGLDTAFALLFLNRSNLVSDLTERLQLHMPIVDREPREK